MELPGEVLTPAEANALIAACSARSRIGTRNRALIVVMYRSGLRLAEALALRPADVDPARGAIRVRHGKGNKPRMAPLDPGGMATVLRWMEARKADGIRGTTLFCTLGGGPLSQQYVRQMLGRLKAKAGITKRVHPHGLRHSFAHDAHREGKPVGAIQKALGHTRLTTTAIYLDHLGAADVIETMTAREWAEPA